MRARYDLTPRRVGELKARGTRAARRPLRTHRPLAAISGCGSGGRSATPVFLCRRHHLRWQRSGHRGTRRSPSSRRGRAKQHAQEQSRRSRYPEVAPRRTDLVLSAEPVSCSRRVSVHDRGNETTSLGLSKNPAFASSTNTSPPLAGCLLAGRLEDGTLRLHRPE